MALNKRTYSDGNTVITAQNLNDIQDEVIANGNNKVNKSGDTMTGNLILKAAADIDSPPSSTSYRSVSFQGSNNTRLGGVINAITANGATQLLLIDYNKNDGTEVSNYLSFGISATGTKSVSVSDPDLWLKAFDLGTSGALPITIAQGGTGQTAVSSTSTVSQIATAASGITITSANYHQWGKIAQIAITATKTAAQSSVTTVDIATLVSGKRPIETTGTMTNNANAQYAYVGANGTIRVRGTFTENQSFSVFATYILA